MFRLHVTRNGEEYRDESSDPGYLLREFLAWCATLAQCQSGTAELYRPDGKRWRTATFQIDGF